jgi:hypothetical protein
MQYMCLIYAPTGAPEPSPQEQQQIFGEYMSFTQHARDAKAMVDGAPLQPPDTATTVRLRNGERLVTDGPFAETKEWLAGFYTFDCGSLDEAIDWAAKIPGAKYGSIEVRPVMDIPGM